MAIKKKLDESYISDSNSTESNTSTSSSCKPCWDNSWILIFFMIILSFITIASMWIIVKWWNIGWYKVNWVRAIVQQEILANEIEKVWGKENYELVSKLQKQQIAQALAQYKQQNGGKAPADETAKPAKPKIDAKEEKNKLEVFIMAYCPFWEIAMKQVPALFKQFAADKMAFDVHYIASKTWEWFKAADFQSLHGIPEAEEDIRQLCIKKEYWVSKLVDYMMVRYANADNYWKVSEGPETAISTIGWDSKIIDTCVNSWEGWKLLAEDIKRADAYGVQWSPTWIANNVNEFSGIEWKKIAESFCSFNKDLPTCKDIKIESNSSNPNSTPKCGN